MALLSGSAAATESASFLFFPLSFLTATFVPFELLSGWLAVAARLNPITYVLGATRSLINDGWQRAPLLSGLTACLALFVVLFAFAVYSLRVRTRRR